MSAISELFDAEKAKLKKTSETKPVDETAETTSTENSGEIPEKKRLKLKRNLNRRLSPKLLENPSLSKRKKKNYLRKKSWTLFLAMTRTKSKMKFLPKMMMKMQKSEQKQSGRYAERI